MIGYDDVYTPYDLREQIAKNVSKFTESLLDTDRDKLVSIINNGLDEGLSVSDIRRQIVNDFGTYSKTQAELITRTEVSRVSNQASLDAFRQSGVVEGKQWVTYGAIDEFADYNGKIVYDLRVTSMEIRANSKTEIHHST